MTLSQQQPTVRAALLVAVIALAVTVASCSASGNSDAAASTRFDPEDYAGGGMLVTAEWVAENIDDGDLRLIDLSAVRTYRSGHLPGAVHVWWQDTIEVHNEIYGMMPDRETRAQLFRDAGITGDSFVVVYDDVGGHDAARFLWLLNAIGFENVALLHGGRQAWEDAGFDLTTDSPDVPDGEILQEANYDVLIGADDVQAAIEDPNVVIIDGRTDEQREETWFDRLRRGAIPGSLQLPRDETLQDGDVPYFKSPEDLQAMLPDGLEPGTDQQVVVYGLHGVAASHTWLTMRLLGFENVRMYDGSWAEWGADPDRPIKDL